MPTVGTPTPHAWQPLRSPSHLRGALRTLRFPRRGSGCGGARAAMEGGPGSFFDSHCHLQDHRFGRQQTDLLKDALSHGVKWLVVNGTSEDDWASVKQLAEIHRQIVPSFGVHPWNADKLSANWFSRLHTLLQDVPYAAIGETGLDKGPRGKAVDMQIQVEVLRKQLEVAQAMRRPVAVHCVRAFGALDEVLRDMGSFPAGLLLHSYSGPVEMVKTFAERGAYFSFSGFIQNVSPKKAKSVLQAVPDDRLLLETDCPDALPKVEANRLHPLPGDPSHAFSAGGQRGASEGENGEGSVVSTKQGEREGEEETSHAGKKILNHPANIRVVAEVVAELLDVPVENVCQRAYRNTTKLFSFSESRVQ